MSSPAEDAGEQRGTDPGRCVMTGMRGQDQESRHRPARRTVVWAVVGVVVLVAVVVLLIMTMSGGSSGSGGLY